MVVLCWQGARWAIMDSNVRAEQMDLGPGHGGAEARSAQVGVRLANHRHLRYRVGRDRGTI